MTSVALARPSTAVWLRWRPVLAWWAISRAVTGAAFLVLYALGPHGHLTSNVYGNPFELFGVWDGVWYARIAQHGYLLIPGRQSDPAFFPLFPIMMRGLHALLGCSYTTAGVVIANVSMVVAVIAFYELSLHVVDRERARRAACFAAVTPMAFVYSMAYPESFALALTALALLAAYSDRWVLAAALAALAVLARPEAIVLCVPLAALAWSHRSRLDPVARGRALAAILAAPVAVVTYPVYLQYAIHDAGAWGKAQTLWGRAFHLSGPWRAISTFSKNVGPDPGLARDLGFLVAYALLLVVAWRARIGLSWILGALLILLLPLFSDSFQSEARFGLLALPVYWGMATLMRTRRAELLVQTGSLLLLVTGVLLLPAVWP